MRLPTLIVAISLPGRRLGARFELGCKQRRVSRFELITTAIREVIGFTSCIGKSTKAYPSVSASPLRCSHIRAVFGRTPKPARGGGTSCQRR
jgi:hypothetical protein